MVVNQSLWVKASIVAFVIGVFLATLTISMVGWWTFGPVSDPVTYVNPENHKAFLNGDNTLVVHREFIVHRPIMLNIERELVRIDKPGQQTRIDLPNQQISFKLTPEGGVQVVNRKIPLPQTLEPGRYDLDFKVTYQANPIRVAEMFPPPITLEVK